MKKHARWTPIVAVWRHTVRATDGLQTTIMCSPVNRVDQTLSLDLSLGMSLPMPHQDEHLPDQIEAYLHKAGLEFQRRLFQVLIEKADQELALQQRHGKGDAGIERRGGHDRDIVICDSRIEEIGNTASSGVLVSREP
jgi:hypothetical protein